MADFQLVTKGHRLCAKSRNTTRVKLPVPTNDKECFLNEDVLCSRIVQRKCVSLFVESFLKFSVEMK